MKSTTTTTKREAISYGRFSSSQQELGDSTSRQKLALQTVCERYSDRLTPSTRFQFGHFFGKGESGFHGAHLKEGGSLQRFLQALKSGQIDPHKTALVIEMWSRFGRQEPDLTIGLLSQIVRAGCVVVVYSPDMWVDTADLSSRNFAIIAMMVQQAHEESKEKSRIGKANRQRIRDTGLTKKGKRLAACPSWLELNKDGTDYQKVTEPKPGKVVASVLYEAALEATKKDSGCKTIARKLGLNQKSLTTIFRSRTLMGEFTPFARTRKRYHSDREVCGEVKKDRYPALLTEAEFYELQNALDSRVKVESRGRKGKDENPTSLFTGLVVDASNNQQMTIHRGSRGQVDLLERTETPGSKRVRYPVLEAAMLKFLVELTPEVLATKNPTQKEINEVTGRIQQVEKQAGALMAMLGTDQGEGTFVGQALARLDVQKVELVARLESLRRASATTQADCLNSIQLLSQSPNVADTRTQMKQAIRGLIEEIRVHTKTTTDFVMEITLQDGSVRWVSSSEKMAVDDWKEVDGRCTLKVRVG